MKLKKDEKFIQVFEMDVYHVGLTNKGRFLQLDIFEERPSLGTKGAVFILNELKVR